MIRKANTDAEFPDQTIPTAPVQSGQPLPKMAKIIVYAVVGNGPAVHGVPHMRRIDRGTKPSDRARIVFRGGPDLETDRGPRIAGGILIQHPVQHAGLGP